MSGRITQNDIAKKLGLTQAVVSMVLTNKDGSASDDTKQRILKTAREMGYFSKRKSTARLRGSKHIVCVLTKDQAYVTDPYHQRFINGCQKAVLNNGSILVSHTVFSDNDSIPSHLLDSVDGFISTFECPEPFLALISSKPVVYLNAKPTSNSYDCVMPDNAGGIELAVIALATAGHQRIGYFGIREFACHQRERYDGFVQASTGLGMSLEDVERLSFIPFRNEFSIADVDRLVAETLAEIARMPERPTALVCEADLYALSFLRQAADFGFDVPKDLSVIGFNNINEAAEATPALTTLNQPMEAMGESAVRMLLERIENPEIPARELRCALELKQRDSARMTRDEQGGEI